MMTDSCLPSTVTSLPEVVAWWAERTPLSPALLAPGIDLVTYAELAAVMASVSRQLRSFGVGRQDRVTLLMADDAVASTLLLGVAGAAVAVALNPHAAAPELEALGERLRPRLTIATGAGLIHADRLGAPVLRVEGADPRLLQLAPSGASAFPLPCQTARSAGPDDLAAVVATSGTTSAPRLVPLTHRNLITASANFASAVRLGTRDISLNLGSLSHVLHLACAVPALVSGGAFSIPSDRQPSSLWRALTRCGITWLIGTPAHYALLLEREGVAAQSGPQASGSVRLAISAAAPLLPDLSAKLAEALGVPLLNLYGMSESLYMAMTPPDQEVQPGALGRALCEGLGIVDMGGEAVAAGTTGEIITRGAHVFPGYLDDPTATAAAFLPGGWFRTGDVGYVDEDGVFFLTGRLRELINRGGEKVTPAEVDAALLAHPGVADAAAFGIPDRRLGEEVAAAVMLRPGATATGRELRRLVANRLAPHKIPRRIWFVDELPRTATGKVQRGELTRRFCSTRSESLSGGVPSR
jgi:oxalate---CoA ligase